MTEIPAVRRTPPTSTEDNPTMEWIRQTEQTRLGTGLRRTLRERASSEPLLDLASNDYLDLATNPTVIAGAQQAAAQWGAGSTGSRLVTGTTALHTELEGELAQFVGTASALVFSSGYLANLGVISALSDADTVLICDQLNHASLIDAARISRARVVVTAHRDLAAVATALRERTETKALIVTDAVFSVDGDLAPLRALRDLASEYNAMLIVDEAHSLGVVGDGGKGACHAAGISADPNVVATLTLSKSLGSQGGAAVGSSEVTAHLIDSARTFIFDTALAPACVGSALAALNVVKAEPQRVHRLRENAAALAGIVTGLGLPSPKSDGAVISALVGDPVAAVAAAQVCRDNGVLVGCFRPPSVPDGISRLRLTARATLNAADLELALGALTAACAEPPLSISKEQL